MKKITRYIFGQLLFTVLAVTIVLTCIVWLVQMLRYIDLIANKGIPLLLFLEMVGYLLPNIFVIIIPIAILIAVLFIYNKLIADHELVVMQGAGMGYWQLAKPTIVISLTFTLFLYFITIYFLPFSFRKHRDMALTLRQESLMSLLSVGQFNTFKNYTVYVHHQDAQGNFQGILLYNASQKDKPVLFMAEKGILFDKGAEGTHLLLVNGNRQEKEVATGKPSVLYFDQYVIETKDKTLESGNTGRFLKAHERNMEDLFNPKESVSSEMRLAFLLAAHQRLSSPLYALAFGLLGLCTMILGHFNRKRRTGRILLACIIATFIEVGVMVFLHTSVYTYAMIALSYAFIMIPIIVCLFLLSPWAEDLSERLQRGRGQ